MKDSIKAPRYWVHTGTEELISQYFCEIKNSMFSSKPLGGLWASPFLLEGGYISDWHCCSSKLRIRRNRNAVGFELKREARVFVIDDQSDLMRLIEEVGSPAPQNEFESSLFQKFIDFEKAADHYDVIYLTEIGQCKTRSPFINPEYNLYGWDCASCLILNFDVVINQKKFKIS